MTNVQWVCALVVGLVVVGLLLMTRVEYVCTVAGPYGGVQRCWVTYR